MDADHVMPIACEVAPWTWSRNTLPYVYMMAPGVTRSHITRNITAIASSGTGSLDDAAGCSARAAGCSARAAGCGPTSAAREIRRAAGIVAMPTSTSVRANGSACCWVSRSRSAAAADRKPPPRLPIRPPAIPDPAHVA